MTLAELMKLSKPLADLYTGLETDLIQNIAKYLAQQNTECSTAQWKIKALASLGRLDKSNIRTIAEYAGIAPDMLALALEQSALSAINEFEPGFKKLAEEGIIKNAAVPPESSMANALKSFSRQAQEQLNLVNTVMKYKARSAAGKLIKNAAELADKQSFLDMLNKAAGKAVTGIESRQAAVRQCIKEMCDKGIPCFVDKRGREWSPEAYINMDIRTTCGNAAHQAQFDRMDDYGVDLIAISSHIGARPKCANDQGKIFNRKGQGGYTEDLNGNKIKYYAWSQSSYGEPDGILGINCGHHPYPFVPGISLQRYFPYNKEENDKAYKLSQAQRQLERNVRSRKRECTALDTLGDKEGFQKASVKLKREQNKLKRFCENTGRTYRPDRTATPGFNKSISGKALKSAKSVDNNRDSGIIKAEKLSVFKKIQSGKLPLKLNVGNQNKHIPSSHSYNPEDKKSYIFGDLSTAQKLIDKYHGTGQLKFTKDGKWTNKEFITVEEDIGIIFDVETGNPIKTNRFAIHYGKNGTHIVPRERSK